MLTDKRNRLFSVSHYKTLKIVQRPMMRLRSPSSLLGNLVFTFVQCATKTVTEPTPGRNCSRASAKNALKINHVRLVQVGVCPS